jgi:membrane-associated phospholipid phosphatase
MTRPSAKTSNPLLGPIDLITVAFCGWIVLYLAVGMALGRAQEPLPHLPVYLSILTAVFLMAWGQRNLAPGSRGWRILHFVRSIYPVALFGYFYTSGHAFNRILFPDWLDPFFYRIDHAIFGYYPSLEWGQMLGHWFWQELFHLAYFCYYPMIAGLPVYLYFRNRKAFGELIFALTFVFYLCYWFYSLVPVIGGRYFPEAMALTKVYHAGPFTHIMAYIYNKTTHLGGAFPSSHIAVTIVLTIAGLKFVRPWGYLFCVISLFLSIATVFCHYHWFIDAVAGIGTGIGGYYLALFVRSKLPQETL